MPPSDWRARLLRERLQTKLRGESRHGLSGLMHPGVSDLVKLDDCEPQSQLMMFQVRSFLLTQCEQRNPFSDFGQSGQHRL